MPLSVMIVEDEFIIAEDISSALLVNGYKLFGIAYSYEQALEMLKKEKPDFALVDITLNGEQEGLKLGKLFSESLQIPFIYVTSHADIGTIEKVKLTNPAGYLLKPFKRESIYTTIEIALAGHNNKDHSEKEQAYLVKQGNKKVKILFSEILFLQSDGNYTDIYTIHTKFTERKTLKELMDEMQDHPFIRTHKSYAVNKNKIHQFSREKVVLGGYEIPVGRTYQEELSNYLNK